MTASFQTTSETGVRERIPMVFRRVERANSRAISSILRKWPCSSPISGLSAWVFPAVPLIFEDLRREPDQWFWALEAITEENPVLPEAAGKVREMARAWIDSGKRHGFLDP